MTMLSLNLLPTDRKQKFQLERQLSRWRGAMSIIILGGLFTMASVATMDWMLTQTLNKTTSSLATWQALSAKRESGQVKDVTVRLNASITGLQGLFSPLATHQQDIAQVLSTIPENIALNGATFNSDGSFTLSGVALTRAAFLSLRSALDASPVIESISTTSTANQRENLPFEYTGQLKLQP